MAEILKFRKPSLKEKHQGKARQFDVRQGRLVTCYRCQRCGKERVTAH